ncbi:hypothetical protein OsI_05320 [Oryza sativa Indica Group]|uniref:Uncharacterized protein n=1 Tax=Oryza sativa subsp. indica TaxID=39946 RepID=B8A9L1_ORYSI|nr:hypothetical protein OsI_05320 [Oryza sativa Indica Group]
MLHQSTANQRATRTKLQQLVLDAAKSLRNAASKQGKPTSNPNEARGGLTRGVAPRWDGADARRSPADTNSGAAERSGADDERAKRDAGRHGVGDAAAAVMVEVKAATGISRSAF